MTIPEKRKLIRDIVRRIGNSDMPQELSMALIHPDRGERERAVKKVFNNFGTRHTEIRNDIIFKCNKSHFQVAPDERPLFKEDINMMGLLILLAIAGREDLESFVNSWKCIDALNVANQWQIAEYLEAGKQLSANYNWLVDATE